MAPTKKAAKPAGKKPAAVKAKPVPNAKKPAPKPPEAARPVSAPPKKTKEEPKVVTNKGNYSREELNFFRTIILDKKKEILQEL